DQEKLKVTSQDQEKLNVTSHEQEKTTGTTQAKEKPTPELKKPNLISQEHEKIIGTTQELKQEKTEETTQEVEKPITSVQEQEKSQVEQNKEGTIKVTKPPKWKAAPQEPQRDTVPDFAVLLPPVEKEPETPQGWMDLCMKEWRLTERTIILPDNPNWKDLYKKKPFGRNFLKSPNPEGLSTSQPPPQEEFDPPPEKKPLETLG
ncbi:hypothetical protein GDO81_028181, partial [Engystomops pustulosus]